MTWSWNLRWGCSWNQWNQSMISSIGQVILTKNIFWYLQSKDLHKRKYVLEKLWDHISVIKRIHIFRVILNVSIVTRPRNGFETVNNIKVVSINSFKQLEVANKVDTSKPKLCVYCKWLWVAQMRELCLYL